jgi:hypothetical protein
LCWFGHHQQQLHNNGKCSLPILENKDNNNFIVDVVLCISKRNAIFILGESKQAMGSLVKKPPSLAQMDVVVMCPHASP